MSVPDHATETVESFKSDLEKTDEFEMATGPMAEGETRSDEFEIDEVRTRVETDPTLGRVLVVEAVLDMVRGEYVEALMTEDNARRAAPDRAVQPTPQRSYAEGVYNLMADHGIERPETPTLGVALGSYYDEDGELYEERPTVQGVIPLEDEEVETDGGIFAPAVIDTGMTLAAFLSMGAAGMAHQLVNNGEDYTVRTALGTASLDVGLYNEATDLVADTDDLAGITTEPGGTAGGAVGNYVRQTAAFSSAAIGGNHGLDNDALIAYDVTNTTGTVDSWFCEVNFTPQGGTLGDHLLCTGPLSQTYDLGNLTNLDINAGDGAGNGVGWTIN